MESYLRLEATIENAYPEEIREVHAALREVVAQAVAEVKADCGQR